MKRLHWFSRIILAETFIFYEICNHFTSLMDPIFCDLPYLNFLSCCCVSKAWVFFIWLLFWSEHCCFWLFCANCLALVFLIGFNGNFLGHYICTFHLGFRSKIFFMENRGKNNEHWRLLSWDFYLRQQKFVNTCTTSAIWSRSNHHLLSLYVKNNSLIKDYDLNDVGFV